MRTPKLEIHFLRKGEKIRIEVLDTEVKNPNYPKFTIQERIKIGKEMMEIGREMVDWWGNK